MFREVIVDHNPCGHGSGHKIRIYDLEFAVDKKKN